MAFLRISEQTEFTAKYFARNKKNTFSGIYIALFQMKIGGSILLLWLLFTLLATAILFGINVMVYASGYAAYSMHRI